MIRSSLQLKLQSLTALPRFESTILDLVLLIKPFVAACSLLQTAAQQCVSALQLRIVHLRRSLQVSVLTSKDTSVCSPVK